MKAHVSDKKKTELALLVKLIENSEKLALLDLTSLPSPQFQKIRKKLKSNLDIRVTKKRLIKLAIEKLKEKKQGIEKLLPSLETSMPALLFTKEDPFKLCKLLDKNKSAAPAKPGQIAPKDITIPAGPTSFPPGPIIGELGQAGIKASLVDGKVTIKEDAVIIKKGEEFSPKQADLAARFGIEPMEIGLNLTVLYDNGQIFTREVLTIDESVYMNNLKKAFQEAMNLSVFAKIPTKDNIKLLIQKANREATALADSQDIITSDNVKKIVSKANAQGLALKNKLNLPEQEKKIEEPKTEEKPVEEPKEEKPVETPKELETEAPVEKDAQESPSEEKSKEEKSKNPADYNEGDAKVAKEVLEKLTEEKIKAKQS